MGDALSDALSGLGLLIGALAGGVVAVLGALDRVAARRDKAMRRLSHRIDILEDQVEWHHRREHDLCTTLGREGITPPDEHAPYPKDEETPTP